MRKVFLGLLIFLMIAGSASAAPIFYDGFSRPDSAAVGNGWKENTGGWDVRYKQLFARGPRDFLSRGNTFGSIVCLQINSFDQRTDNVFELVRSNASGARVHAAYQSTSETDNGYKRLVYFDSSVNFWRVCANNVTLRPSTMWCMNMNSPYQQWLIDDYGTRKMCNMPGNHAVPDNYWGPNFLGIDNFDPESIYLDNVCTANDLQSCIAKRSPCSGVILVQSAPEAFVRLYKKPDTCLNTNDYSKIWNQCTPAGACRTDSTGRCDKALQSGDYVVIAKYAGTVSRASGTLNCGELKRINV